MTDKETLDVFIDLIQDKKGQNISLLDLRSVESASFDYFVVCEGNANIQVRAIADHLMKGMNDRYKIKPCGYDGFATLEWIVVDYGNILLHILLPEKRKYYDLESLWSDAKIKNIPNID